MNRYLPKLEPRRYLYELLADYPTRGGKMLRSSLWIAMARATGAELEDAIPSAVSIELRARPRKPQSRQASRLAKPSISNAGRRENRRPV